MRGVVYKGRWSLQGWDSDMYSGSSWLYNTVGGWVGLTVVVKVGGKPF